MEREILDYLVSGDIKICLDCTLGMGGHAAKILELISPNGRLIGIDIDPQAIELAKDSLGVYGERATLIHGNFADLDQILNQFGISQVDGVLMDLGVSSLQLDMPDRGFSFMRLGPLDMRMDQTEGVPIAYDLNEKNVDELANIIRNYGEERWARRIATEIVKAREKSPIMNTIQLAEIIKTTVPTTPKKIHPATKTFQSLRIYKNNELINLKIGIEKAVQFLKPGGRICVISFHSLEDRIVKQLFRTMERGCICPPKFPVCVCGKKPLLKILTKRPLTPKDEEIESNPRARSAKLRVAEKI